MQKGYPEIHQPVWCFQHTQGFQLVYSQQSSYFYCHIFALRADMVFWLSAKSGKATGPVMPYDCSSMKDAYDPRRLIRDATLPPHPTMRPAYSCHRNTNKADKMEVEREFLQQQKPSHHCLAGKVAQETAVDIRPSPFYLAGVTRADPIEGNLLQTKSPFSGIAAAAAAAAAGAHRKIGPVQFGMSRLY